MKATIQFMEKFFAGISDIFIAMRNSKCIELEIIFKWRGMSNVSSYRSRFASALFLLSFSLQIYALTYFGAGVLPYAVNPNDNKVYFLFSREAFGKDRGTWADFGGGAERKDKNNPLNIAAREFHEESIGLYGSYQEGKSFLSKKSSVVSSQIVRKRGDAYILYFVKVEFASNINQRFQKKRKRARSFHLREKDELAWISAQRLQDTLRHNSPTVNNGSGRLITIRPSLFKTLQKKSASFVDQLAAGRIPKGAFLKLK